jgi:small subunit ribosomal protein S21
VIVLVEVIRKDDEPIESLLHRFSKKVMQSRVLSQARKKKHFEKPKSRMLQKEEATRRKFIKDRREFLRRTGKIGFKRMKEEAARARRRNSHA